MAIGVVMHTFDVQLADVDRGVYEDLTLRLGRHPSETAEFLVTRLLAYCLEYTEGIGFSEGISATNEPAVSVRDATGRMTAWIEVGSPDAERLHHGSRLAGRVAIYTHRDPARVLPQYAGKKIHEVERIALRSFDPGFVESAAALLDRRNTVTVSVTEGQLYLDVNGTSLSSPVHVHPLG
ncbi:MULTISPECIES: YaeQ family protein [unclassified Microbacterium]|uniref:YaeQ family protein n=1 Tax=unclassified Microbacterium TaxID=2609290 RepID=UPI00301A8A13